MPDRDSDGLASAMTSRAEPWRDQSRSPGTAARRIRRSDIGLRSARGSGDRCLRCAADAAPPKTPKVITTGTRNCIVVTPKLPSPAFSPARCPFLGVEVADIRHRRGEVAAAEAAEQREDQERRIGRVRALHGIPDADRRDQQRRGAERGPEPPAEDRDHEAVEDAQRRPRQARQRPARTAATVVERKPDSGHFATTIDQTSQTESPGAAPGSKSRGCGVAMRAPVSFQNCASSVRQSVSRCFGGLDAHVRSFVLVSGGRPRRPRRDVGSFWGCERGALRPGCAGQRGQPPPSERYLSPSSAGCRRRSMRRMATCIQTRHHRDQHEQQHEGRGPHAGEISSAPKAMGRKKPPKPPDHPHQARRPSRHGWGNRPGYACRPPPCRGSS